MANRIKTTFNPSDKILKKLVTERRKEVLRLQASEATQLRYLRSRGQEEFKTFKKALSKDIIAVLERQDQIDKDASVATKSLFEKVKVELAQKKYNGQNISDLPYSDWLTPYVAILHDSDGKCYYNDSPVGKSKLWCNEFGGGSGVCDYSSAFTMYLDWWFTFDASQARIYNHIFTVPFRGYYQVYANDGTWTSKEAYVRIDLSVQNPIQFGNLATSTINVLNIKGSHINASDRVDVDPTLNYSEPLVMETQIYLNLTASFKVYARGGGSAAVLNFSDGNYNYMGVPRLNVG